MFDSINQLAPPAKLKMPRGDGDGSDAERALGIAALQTAVVGPADP